VLPAITIPLPDSNASSSELTGNSICVLKPVEPRPLCRWQEFCRPPGAQDERNPSLPAHSARSVYKPLRATPAERTTPRAGRQVSQRWLPVTAADRHVTVPDSVACEFDEEQPEKVDKPQSPSRPCSCVRPRLCGCSMATVGRNPRTPASRPAATTVAQIAGDKAL